MSEPKPVVPYEDFAKLDFRVAKILEVSEHPNADKLIVMKVDLGGEQRQIVAGLRGRVDREKLAGSLVVLVANLAPATIRGVESNGMLLAAADAGEPGRVVTLTTLEPVAAGSRIS